MRKLLLILCVQMFCLALVAAPANPGPMVYLQSDGTELSVSLKGDEFFHWFETSDGYTLLRKENGDFMYAELDRLQGLVFSEQLAHNPSDRTFEESEYLQTIEKNIHFKSNSIKKSSAKKSARRSERSPASKAPTTGVRKQILLFVQFQDVKFSTNYQGTAQTTKPLFDSLMNGENYTDNGNTGSVKKYYRDNSNGAFSLETTVFGPVTLPNTMAYYGGNDGNGEDLRPRQMVSDALSQLSSTSNFKPFANSNNRVESIYVIYAGYGEEGNGPANAVWAHQWSLSGSVTYGGATFYHTDYACSPELSEGSGNTPTNIGVICHEFGHTLGLSDMYDTDYGDNGTAKGLGPWSLMANGSWNNNGKTPPFLTGFEREKIGWATPIEVSDYQEITFPPIGESGVSYFFYAKNALGGKNTNERFYIENRNATSSGSWDSKIFSNTYYTTSGGLMVYHLDQIGGSVWTSNKVNINPDHENCKIVSAKGSTSNYHLDPFPQAGADSLTDNSTPNTKSWLGYSSGLPIKKITKTGVNISFTIGNRTSITMDTIFNSFCAQTDFVFKGKTYTASGVFRDTVKTPGEIDSIFILKLDRMENTDYEYNKSVCSGKSYSFFSHTLISAGRYADTLFGANANGCDSIVRVNLSMIPVSPETHLQKEICSCDSFFFQNKWLKNTGYYTDTLTNAGGCDSIVNLELTLLSENSYSYNASICENDSTFFNSRWIKEPGKFLDTLNNAAGCDSIITLNVSLNYRTGAFVFDTIISGDSIVFNDSTFKLAGTYHIHLKNSFGCDSIITFMLSVVNSSANRPLVSFDNSETVKTIPNPVRTNEAFMVLIPDFDKNSSESVIEIYGITGELILSKPARGAEVEILGLNRPGTYILRVLSKTNPPRTTKIIVIP